MHFSPNVQLNPTDDQLEKFYKDFSVKPAPVEKAKKGDRRSG